MIKKTAKIKEKIFCVQKILSTFATAIARIAQLVEHNLAKVRVAGSSPVSRSFFLPIGEENHGCPGGGIGRRAGLKIPYSAVDVPVRDRPRVLKKYKLSILRAFFLFVNLKIYL